MTAISNTQGRSSAKMTTFLTRIKKYFKFYRYRKAKHTPEVRQTPSQIHIQPAQTENKSLIIRKIPKIMCPYSTISSRPATSNTFIACQKAYRRFRGEHYLDLSTLFKFIFLKGLIEICKAKKKNKTKQRDIRICCCIQLT